MHNSLGVAVVWGLPKVLQSTTSTRDEHRAEGEDCVFVKIHSMRKYSKNKNREPRVRVDLQMFFELARAGL